MFEWLHLIVKYAKAYMSLANLMNLLIPHVFNSIKVPKANTKIYDFKSFDE